jgi:hypothetical protein
MKRWICLLKIWIGIHIIVLGITMWICWGLRQNILCEEYGRLENNASTFIGSLLTIWTVLAAALIFYMGKPEREKPKQKIRLSTDSILKNPCVSFPILSIR